MRGVVCDSRPERTFNVMNESLDALQKTLEPYPWTYNATMIGALLLIAWVANWLTKRVLLRGLRRALHASQVVRESDAQLKVIPRLANVVPALVLWLGVGVVPHLPEEVVLVVRNVCSAFIILTLALAIAKSLDLANQVYERRPDAASKPIKGYLQLLKIVVYAVAAVLMLAALMDRSPLILLSGLGAMMAVLLLVFQDTLLSLVASMQISSNDMVRVGDCSLSSTLISRPWASRSNREARPPPKTRRRQVRRDWPTSNRLARRSLAC